jgi:hypothetical protein
MSKAEIKDAWTEWRWNQSAAKRSPGPIPYQGLIQGISEDFAGKCPCGAHLSPEIQMLSRPSYGWGPTEQAI